MSRTGGHEWTIAKFLRWLSDKNDITHCSEPTRADALFFHRIGLAIVSGDRKRMVVSLTPLGAEIVQEHSQRVAQWKEKQNIAAEPDAA